jgi:hypothetical protein
MLTRFLKSVARRTPLYTPANNWVAVRRQRHELRKWETQGRPVPPPHFVKQQTIRRFAVQYGLTILVETGTYYGDMVEAMKRDFRQIYSIELSPELHAKARQRFARDANVELIQGDSGTELQKIVNQLAQPALFWLDGHYSGGVTARGEKDTPIFEELNQIFNSPLAGHVIVIDDARCFGTEPGYPTITELGEFIHSQRPAAKIEVADDSIRITA